MMKKTQFLSLSLVSLLNSCGSEELVTPTPTPPPPRPTSPTVDANFHYQSQLMISGTGNENPKCLHVLGSQLASSDCSTGNRFFEKHLDQSLRTSDGLLCLSVDSAYQVKMDSCRPVNFQKWNFLTDGRVQSIRTPDLCLAQTQAGVFLLRSCAHTEVVKLSDRNQQFYESYLYNPGPRFLAGQTKFAPVSGAVEAYRGQRIAGTNLSEAHLVGAPADACKDVVINDGAGPVSSSNKSCPTYFHETQTGWKVDSQDAYPGYAIWTLAGGASRPLLFQYLNNSLSSPQACELKEVGLSFRGSNTPVLNQLRPKADGSKRKFGDFANLMATFTGRVQYSNLGVPSAPACANGFASANVSVDLSLSFSRNGQVVRSDLMSIITHYGFEWNPGSPIFWKDRCGISDSTCGIGFKADRVGLPLLGTETQSYIINYSQIIARLITSGNYTLPEGFRIEDAVVEGLRVNVSTRGADLGVMVQGLDLYGLN
jgi:hypothetical protein